MTLEFFHPIIGRWFRNRFGSPTEPQRLGWPKILAGQNTLICAPTGSGKTLAAFLACIDRLLREGIAGTLADATQVVYVSPLKALSNDVRRNLEVPLQEIRQVAMAEGIELPEIRALVRTGDTPSRERQAMTRRPPHILVTTPESLYLILTAEKGREILRTVQTMIVDEIHALARDKRGSHLALSLERLEALCGKPPLRIGLSATVRPVHEIARFLVGSSAELLECGDLSPLSGSQAILKGDQNKVDQSMRRSCDDDASPDDPKRRHVAALQSVSIVDVGHVRELDLGIEVPRSELSAVCSHEQWAENYARIVELVRAHRSTLIFVNTRRLSERIAHNLRQQLGDDSVAAHHGSLSRDIRLAAEERLKNGQLKAIVATASLELGIDIGFIDLVCQIGSPRSIATFLQRVGRSGHSLGRIPRGRLFPLTRDELIECLALLRAVRSRRLDAVEIPVGPLDILAQQIVAAVACEEWKEDELFKLCRRAWPYQSLVRHDFDQVVEMLSEGFGVGRRRGAYLHRDQVNGRLRARRGARLAAATSGGAIPETGDYRVVTETERTFVGTVNEDFAIESMAGDIFVLGNTSWRIRHVRAGEVVVNDAQGAPATIPFWLGEAPARTVELSEEVSRLREELAQRTGEEWDSDEAREKLDPKGTLPVSPTPALPHSFPTRWLQQECGVDEWPAQQAAKYVAAQQAAIGLVPTQKQVVFERFFDESGGMQLVIHAPFGGRINRAWGLALRKRFCRSFDFELQASADDNGIVLSLGPQHSFPIEQMFKMLRPDNGEHLLTQALLAVPMFGTRWRWNTTRSLAVLRQHGGKRVPPYLQRFRAADLLTAVFPAQTACFENRPEDVAIPDHPLVRQTIYDCLHEAMDLPRWLELLKQIDRGEVQLIARDTREPSPFSHQILNANPYAFLDDAPLEERRARAVAMRRSFTVEAVRDLGQLDPAAIAQVRAEAWPVVRDADELHDVLLLMGALPAAEGTDWGLWFQELVAAGRATEAQRSEGTHLWVAAERWALARAAFSDAVPQPALSISQAAVGTPTDSSQTQPAVVACSQGSKLVDEASQAWVALVRGRLECLGPQTASRIAADLGLRLPAVQAALEALEGEGFVLRGQFTPGKGVFSTEYSAPNTQSPARPSRNQTSEVSEDFGSLRTKSTNLAITNVGNGLGAVPSFEGTPRPGGPSPQRDSDEVEWCERRLLARIHRLTLDGLRRQIQPVEPADFLRFLLVHHHLAPDAQLSGRAGAAAVIEQLQGFELPAGDWEHEILTARVADYDPAVLDDLTLSGQVAWGRLRPPHKTEDDSASGSTMNRVVPISLVLREDLGWLLPAERSSNECAARSDARSVFEALTSRGALFAHDLRAITSLLPAQMEDALSELAALGLVTADGFASIRSLASPDRRRIADLKRRRLSRGRMARGMFTREGRWSLFPGPLAGMSPDERAERWAWQLLRRYGVVFRDLLAREAVAPPWRVLVPTYRRLEARGEIRGGRFVSGVAGEQFATAEAVEQLRRVRDERPAKDSHWLVISACDPAGLFGILGAGPRVSAIRGNRLAIRDGRVVASIVAGEIKFYEEFDAAQADEIARVIRQTGSTRRRDSQLALSQVPS